MISTTFSLDENKLMFYSTYKEHVKIDFILFSGSTVDSEYSRLC